MSEAKEMCPLTWGAHALPKDNLALVQPLLPRRDSGPDIPALDFPREMQILKVTTLLTSLPHLD